MLKVWTSISCAMYTQKNMTNGRMDRRTDRQTDKSTDGQKTAKFKYGLVNYMKFIIFSNFAILANYRKFAKFVNFGNFPIFSYYIF